MVQKGKGTANSFFFFFFVNKNKNLSPVLEITRVKNVQREFKVTDRLGARARTDRDWSEWGGGGAKNGPQKTTEYGY